MKAGGGRQISNAAATAVTAVGLWNV